VQGHRINTAFKEHILLHKVLDYYNLGLYKKKLNLWDILLTPSEIVEYFNLRDTGDNTECLKRYLGLYTVLVTEVKLPADIVSNGTTTHSVKDVQFLLIKHRVIFKLWRDNLLKSKTFCDKFPDSTLSCQQNAFRFHEMFYDCNIF
jgi:hypothetical protein